MKDRDRPESQRRYRYWVEIRDLRDGSVRSLPLTALRLVHLAGKRDQSPLADEQVLRIQDDSTVIEAKDIDDLAAQLRNAYPDETHERLLHRERDVDAEQRYATALQSLLELLAEVAVDDVLREQAVERNMAERTQGPANTGPGVRKSRPRRTD
jgi:hypothetical protein